MIIMTSSEFCIKIRNALDLREGSAFERGKFIGRLEKETAWQAYHTAWKTRESLMNARRSLKFDSKEKIEDWSTLSDEDILKKLIERRVVVVQETGDNAESKESTQSMKCSEGFLAVCRRCIQKEST